MHGEDGRLTRAFRHICWDGCMFPNEVMQKRQTWNDILSAMIAVRDAHGWREIDGAEVKPPKTTETVVITKAAKEAARKTTKPAKGAARKTATRKVMKAKVKKVAKRPVKKTVKLKTSKSSGKKAVKKAVKKAR